MAFDFDKAVDTLADNKILTKVLLILLLDVSSTYANLPTYTYNAIKQTAQLGLLTRLENAGFTLSTAALPSLPTASLLSMYAANSGIN